MCFQGARIIRKCCWTPSNKNNAGFANYVMISSPMREHPNVKRDSYPQSYELRRETPCYDSCQQYYDSCQPKSNTRTPSHGSCGLSGQQEREWQPDKSIIFTFRNTNEQKNGIAPFRNYEKLHLTKLALVPFWQRRFRCLSIWIAKQNNKHGAGKTHNVFG